MESIHPPGQRITTATQVSDKKNALYILTFRKIAEYSTLGSSSPGTVKTEFDGFFDRAS
jgi:hypothetical protein